jgi:hypothetical protein
VVTHAIVALARLLSSDRAVAAATLALWPQQVRLPPPVFRYRRLRIQWGRGSGE